MIFRFVMHPISAESSRSLATNHALSAESPIQQALSPPHISRQYKGRDLRRLLLIERKAILSGLSFPVEHSGLYPILRGLVKN